MTQSSYFYFDLLKDSNGIPRNIYELDSNGNKIKDESYPRGYKEMEVTLEHIVSQKHKGQEVLVNFEKGDDIFTEMRNKANETFNSDKLNGEFGEIQAKNFAKRYEIIFHQPNTLTGFSATLFSDKTKNRFIVGFRGTEFSANNINELLETLKDLGQDIALSLNANPQSFALLVFLKEVRKIVQVYNRPTIFVGHSLGGYLAQVALIYCDKKYKNELLFSPKEVYTFNAPSIYGWNLPNVVLNPNTIKILLDFLGKNIVDISKKLTHIYDGGGINIIASAQYGSSNRLPIYTGKDSHSIIPLTQTLYFYSYLLELESNIEILQANNNDISQSLENLNALSNAIHRILEDISFQEATGYGEDLYIPPTPHYLYATIDKTLFEATLHTKQKKLQVDITTLIEGILYLQNNNIFLQLLTQKSMQEVATDTASRESNLAILLAIHERLFFISVLKQDNQAQALIQTKNDITTLLKHNTTRAQIFCYNLEHIDEKLMRGYLNDAFRFYPFIDKKKVA